MDVVVVCIMVCIDKIWLLLISHFFHEFLCKVGQLFLGHSTPLYRSRNMKLKTIGFRITVCFGVLFEITFNFGGSIQSETMHHHDGLAQSFADICHQHQLGNTGCNLILIVSCTREPSAFRITELLYNHSLGWD